MSSAIGPPEQAAGKSATAQNTATFRRDTRNSSMNSQHNQNIKQQQKRQQEHHRRQQQKGDTQQQGCQKQQRLVSNSISISTILQGSQQHNIDANNSRVCAEISPKSYQRRKFVKKAIKRVQNSPVLSHRFQQVRQISDYRKSNIARSPIDMLVRYSDSCYLAR